MSNCIRARFQFRHQDFSFSIDEEVPARGLTAVFGPSGSGKTSFLRLIAGLDKVPDGYLEVNDDIWQNEKFFVPSYKRGAAFVFQSAGLLPHLNVADNLRFATSRARKSERALERAQVLAVCGIEKLLDRAVSKLSGGESQRVAIACALLSNPRILLMDEPMSALDQSAKNVFLRFLERLKTDLSIPILYVTHSIAEVARLADHIIQLRDGRIVAIGAANDIISELSEQDSDEDLAVVISARVAEINSDWQLARLHFDAGDIWLHDENYTLDQTLRLSVPAKDVSIALTRHLDTSILNCVAAKIESIDDMNKGFVRVRLRAGASGFIARITALSRENLALEVGQEVFLQIKSAALLR